MVRLSKVGIRRDLTRSLVAILAKDNINLIPEPVRDSLDSILHISKVASNLVSNMAHLPSKPPLNKLKHIKPFFGLSFKKNSCTT
jgi:hypothetical protein